MAKWIKTSVRYEKQMNNGAHKKVTEQYIVDAYTFAEAEARIIDKVTPFISGDFDVSAVKKADYAEIFRSDRGDRWYHVKSAFIVIDEKTAEEKRNVVNYLVQAPDFHNALENFIEGMKGTIVDFEIVAIVETPIVDVYDINNKDDENQN